MVSSSPSVGLGHTDGWRDAEFFECGGRLGATDNRLNVADCREKSLAIDVSLNLLDELTRADAGQKYDDVNLSGDQAIREVDRVLMLLERHFAHRRADERDAPFLFDHPRHVGCAATFKRGDAQASKGDDIGGHS